MSHLLIIVGISATLAAIWSVPTFREYAMGWLPDPLDELADRWGDVLLSWLVVVLFFVGVQRMSTGGASKAGPESARPPEITGSVDLPSHPLSGKALTGNVEARDTSGKLTPVTTGTVRIGQDSSSLTDTGAFEVSLPDSPQPDTLVEIESPHFLSRFIRLGDPILVQRKLIEIAPKMRIIVIPTEASERDGAGEDIRQSIENELGSEQIEVLSDDKLCDDVLNRLYAYQQDGALYDPRTLARVGNFNGASDGVFWSLARGNNSFTLEYRLVNLTTAKVEYSVSASFLPGAPMNSAAEAAADLLLSQMATAHILTPNHTAEVKRNISVRGYSVYIPKTWTLWICMLPEGNGMMFPQRRLSTHGDQSFFAPDVYAGPEGELSQPLRLDLDAVLTDSEYSQKIAAYIESGVQTGLDMNAWNKERFKILDHITVVRRK